MIPTNNPFRAPGKFERFTASFMAEDDKKPLLTWFNKFEKALKKLGTNYQKSSVNPTDALEYYYDKKSPDEAAEALAEGVQLDEYIKKDGDRKRCAGGDGRRKEVEVSERKEETPQVTFDFKNERDAKQFAKDVENSMVGLANKGVERYKGKYRVGITGATSGMHLRGIGKFAKKNKGERIAESHHATADRQLKDPKKEVMVVDKKGKVIVIDRKDLKRYEKKGWELAESMEEAQSVPLVRTGQGSSTKDTHPKRKDGKIERMYQAKDKNEYASLIIGADTSQKGNVYSVQGSEKNKTVTVVFDNDKQRVSYEKRMKIKESVELSEESDWVLSFEFHSPEYTSKEARAIQNDLNKKFKTYSGNGSFGDGWDCSFNGPKYELEKAKKYVEKKYKKHIEDTAFEINESVELDEGKMKELHMHIEDGKTAEQIAKIMKIDVKAIKALMKDFKESVDDTTPRPSFTEDDQKLLDFINKNW